MLRISLLLVGSVNTTCRWLVYVRIFGITLESVMFLFRVHLVYLSGLTGPNCPT